MEVNIPLRSILFLTPPPLLCMKFVHYAPDNIYFAWQQQLFKPLSSNWKSLLMFFILCKNDLIESFYFPPGQELLLSEVLYLCWLTTVLCYNWHWSLSFDISICDVLSCHFTSSVSLGTFNNTLSVQWLFFLPFHYLTLHKNSGSYTERY
jgi:hypothetical protein